MQGIQVVAELQGNLLKERDLSTRSLVGRRVLLLQLVSTADTPVVLQVSFDRFRCFLDPERLDPWQQGQPEGQAVRSVPLDHANRDPDGRRCPGGLETWTAAAAAAGSCGS